MVFLHLDEVQFIRSDFLKFVQLYNHGHFFFSSLCLYRYEILFSPQPSAAVCQFLSSVELTLQHQIAETNDRVMRQAERLKAEGTTVAVCEEQVQEIEHCITGFLRENGDHGSLGLAGIITSVLCTLCRFKTFFSFYVVLQVKLLTSVVMLPKH